MFKILHIIRECKTLEVHEGILDTVERLENLLFLYNHMFKKKEILPLTPQNMNGFIFNDSSMIV